LESIEGIEPSHRRLRVTLGYQQPHAHVFFPYDSSHTLYRT